MNPDHCAKYAKIRVFTDLYLSVWGPIRRFSPYMGEHEAVKTRILAYFMQCIVIVPERSHYTVGHLKMNQLCLCSNAPVVRKWKFKVIYVLNKGKDFETLFSNQNYYTYTESEKFTFFAIICSIWKKLEISFCRWKICTAQMLLKSNFLAKAYSCIMTCLYLLLKLKIKCFSSFGNPKVGVW